jgi:hypothetical protein
LYFWVEQVPEPNWPGTRLWPLDLYYASDLTARSPLRLRFWLRSVIGTWWLISVAHRAVEAECDLGPR